MFSFLALAAFTLLPAALAQQLTVATPTGVVQCQPVQLKWTGGTAPYFLSLIPAGQSSAPAIKEFPTQNGNSFTWTADLASGTTFTISLKDNTGTQAFSDIVTIQSGSDSSCINTSITESGTGGGAAPTSGGSSAGSSAASTTGSPGASTTGSSSRSSSGSSAASSTAPASTNSPNAAPHNKGNALAVAGVMGLVGAALF